MQLASLYWQRIKAVKVVEKHIPQTTVVPGNVNPVIHCQPCVSLCRKALCSLCGPDSRFPRTQGVAKRETLTLLWSNDMHDTLPLIAKAKICKPMSLDVIFQSHALEPRVLLFDELLDILEVFPRSGRDIVIGCLIRSYYQRCLDAHVRSSGVLDQKQFMICAQCPRNQFLSLKSRDSTSLGIEQWGNSVDLRQVYNLAGGHLGQHYEGPQTLVVL